MCACDVLPLRPDRGLLCEDLTDPITVIMMIKVRVLKRREWQLSQSVAKYVCVYHLRGGRGVVSCLIHTHHLFNVQIRFHHSQSLSSCVCGCVYVWVPWQFPKLVQQIHWIRWEAKSLLATDPVLHHCKGKR